MSHAVWCPTCRKPAECEVCGQEYPIAGRRQRVLPGLT